MIGQQRNSLIAIPVIFIKEAEQFVAYTPALELCTTGLSIEDAKRNFEEIVAIFFDELIEAGTMRDVLEDLGWEFDDDDDNWVPPAIVSHSTESISVRVQ